MIIELIILITFILILVIFITSFLFNTSGLKCPNGYVISNLITGQTRSYPLTYTPGQEVCHDPAACNNPIAPCVYSVQTGSSCPGDLYYTGLLNNTSSCLNRKVCANWVAIGFEEYKNFLLQTDANITICGVQEENLSRIWPASCMRGRLGYNVNDGLWYCMNTNLTCSNIILDTDYVIKCIES